MSDRNITNELSNITRRDFVKKTTLGSAGAGLGLGLGSTAMAFPYVQSPNANRKLKVGLIGIGDRGAGALKDIFSADPDTILWAVGDIFEGKMKAVEGFKKKYSGRVDTDGGKREFLGFDAFQKVIDSGVDIVLLTSTPVFRPEHYKAAVSAGKHVFMEKPFALDMPGLKSIIEDSKKAQSKGLAVLTGLVWRYSLQQMELHKRIDDGEIGDIMSTSSSYCGSGRPNKMPDMKYKPKTMSGMEWSLRYWQSYVELGGDGILEFMIHGIDRMSWSMGDHIPIKCIANGANIAPVVGANAWDSFSLSFEYADGRTSDFFGRQIPGTFAASGDIITGTEGRALSDGKNVSIIKNGKTTWESTGGLDYENEHKILVDHIRKGKVYNDVLDALANSHICCLMGRSAAYTGQLITDKMIMSSTDTLLDTKGIDFNTPFSARPPAKPGETKFI